MFALKAVDGLEIPLDGTEVRFSIRNLFLLAPFFLFFVSKYLTIEMNTKLATFPFISANLYLRQQEF